MCNLHDDGPAPYSGWHHTWTIPFPTSIEHLAITFHKRENRKELAHPAKHNQSRPGSCKHYQRTALPSQPASGGEPRTNWIIVHRYNRPPTKPHQEKKIRISKEVTATLDCDATANHHLQRQTEMKEIKRGLNRKSSSALIVWI